MFYLNNMSINFNNNDEYLGLKHNKGNNLIGEYLNKEHETILKYDKCPDNFYMILEILVHFNNDLIIWLNSYIDEICNYIVIISKYNNIIEISKEHITPLFNKLNKSFILSEKEIYITPLLSSFISEALIPK